jgi:hypothetical protein
MVCQWRYISSVLISPPILKSMSCFTVPSVLNVWEVNIQTHWSRLVTDPCSSDDFRKIAVSKYRTIYRFMYTFIYKTHYMNLIYHVTLTSNFVRLVFMHVVRDHYYIETKYWTSTTTLPPDLSVSYQHSWIQTCTWSKMYLVKNVVVGHLLSYRLSIY